MCVCPLQFLEELAARLLAQWTEGHELASEVFDKAVENKRSHPLTFATPDRFGFRHGPVLTDAGGVALSHRTSQRSRKSAGRVS